MIAFHGTWRAHRRILDARTGGVTRFEGTALISPGHFEEDGIVDHAGQTYQASRRYRLVFGERRVDVHFEDGRPFIALTAASIQSVLHVCGKDRYRGRFLFADHDFWTEAWSVLGPRKNYTALTRYTRIAPRSPLSRGEPISRASAGPRNP